MPPDISGAKGPRAILAAHTKDPSCASCHADIDPLGFVLENRNPIGKWRTTYPSKVKKKKGLPVDASGTLPNGTKLNDVTDLKKYLVDNPEFFANCLAEKLMVYATGRPMNYRERKIIKQIVIKNIKNANGFQDLVIDLIDSEIFKAK